MIKRFAAILSIGVLLWTLCGGAFADSGGLFEYRTLEDGSVMITGYKGSDADLVFPETLDGKPVSALGRSFDIKTVSVKNIRSITVPNTMTTIEPGAFQFAEFLTEFRIAEDHPVLAFEDGVLYNRKDGILLLYLKSNTAEHFDVPDGIREIGELAFFRSRLVSVHIPGSVERIGKESFYQCTALTDAALSEGLKSIETDAFTNCDRLNRIVIPASVTEIGESVFTDSRLREFAVAEGNPVFTVSGGALINTRDGVLIAYPTNAEAESCVIPEGVTRIGSFAFYRAHHLKQVTFPDGLLEIGRGAFLSCDHLTAIDLPDSVVRLEDSAVGGNSDAETLHLPAGLTEIVDNFDDLAVTWLEIPESVTRIEGSFISLRNLTGVTIPGSVQTIGARSFTFCKNLACIVLPAGVTEIRSRFTGCAGTLVIRVEPGSAAEQYCRENGLNWEAVSDAPEDQAP